MVGLIMFVLVALAVVALGFRQIGEKERGAVEVFRKFHGILGPGLKWILPGIMRIKRVPTHELAIPLFESQVKIDFSDGWAIPKNAEIWVVMKSPDDPYSVNGDQAKNGTYRAIYEIGDYKLAIKDLGENALRTYLNRLSVDEAITMQKAGFDLANRDLDAGIPNQELIKVEEALAKWGWEILRITVGDFDVDPALIAARSAVHQARKGAEAAEHEARERSAKTARSTLLIMAEREGKTPEEMQKLIEKSPARRREFLSTVTYQMGTDGNSLVDIRVDGAEGAEKFLLNLLAGWKRMPLGLGKDPATRAPGRQEYEERGQEGEKEDSSVGSILSTLEYSLPRILSKEETARLRKELDDLPKDLRNQWHKWISRAMGSGNLKMG